MAPAGQSKEIASVLSTLAIAVLFTPLRRRVQDFFSATTRQEVKIETPTAGLIQVE